MMRRLYQQSSAITGPLQPNTVVRYRPSLSRRQRLTLVAFLVLILGTSLAFISYLLANIVFHGADLLVGIAVALIILIELIRLLQSFTLILFAFTAKDPVPMVPRKDLRVAVLTTIVPSKEPFGLVAQTLKAMKKLQADPSTKVDVWLLDEGNSPAIRARCEAMGVHYFSRSGLEGWNTPAGPFRARTKHGNHNAWRRAHEHRYDIVAQMDPDHIPRRDFLRRTLGYFTDPDVGFVVAPQVYGNLRENWIARGAAFQAYVFHGIIQRGGNGLQAPLLIGTNHLYRVAALKQINGYQDSIIEDHLTSMVIYGAQNKSGKRWKGVYTPDIVAVGEGPGSFTDFFNQQRRWAYGIWEIALNSTRDCIHKMTRRQAVTFMMLQFFYPSVAVSWVLSSLATLLVAFSHFNSHGVASVVAVLWTYSIASSLSLFFWLRRFNLVEHERRTWGLGGMALLMMCIPVYVSATFQALSRRPLTYAVTAKGSLASRDGLHAFKPHLAWLGYNVALLALLFTFGRAVTAPNAIWVVEHMVICLAPVGLVFVPQFFSAGHRAVQPLLTQLRRVIIWRPVSSRPALNLAKEFTHE